MFSCFVLLLYLINLFINVPLVLAQNPNNLTTGNIVGLVNAKRQLHQLPALVENPLLSQAAYRKAEHMLKTGNFNHYYQSDGKQVGPWQFILDVGYPYHFAGENLARNFNSADDLVEAWYKSQSHQANLLSSNYAETGVAVVEGKFKDQKPVTIVVQLFASALPENIDPTFDPASNYTPTDLLINPSVTEYDWITWLYLPVIIVLLFILGFVIATDFSTRKKKSKTQLPSSLWQH